MAVRQSAMEKMVGDTAAALHHAFSGRSIFITGHTGFKGSWLTLWLARMGARVAGYALPPDTQPSLFELAHIENVLERHVLADVRDFAQLQSAMHASAPEIVFHLAAQPLVRKGFREPLETWSTNVMGTVNVLEAARSCPGIKAVVVVTTDKCYKNLEQVHSGYREEDVLGGSDPYSGSKAAAELVVASYRKSFFSDGKLLLASARAGNVIGGGDWCEDRLIPDMARAAAKGQTIQIRNPLATRPWQHVLAALHGYLLLASNLIEGRAEFADAFNFGPGAHDNLSVESVLTQMKAFWPELAWEFDKPAASAQHEAQLLFLDSSKARKMLDWSPKWELSTGLEKTAEWYQAVARQPAQARAITELQLTQYCS